MPQIYNLTTSVEAEWLADYWFFFPVYLLSQTFQSWDKSSSAVGRFEGSYCSMLSMIRMMGLNISQHIQQKIPRNISRKERIQGNRLDRWERRNIYSVGPLLLSNILWSFEESASERVPLRSEFPELVSHNDRSILLLMMLTSCSASDSSETNRGVPEKSSVTTVAQSRFLSVPQPNDQISMAVP